MMTRPGAVSIACYFGIGLLALALASPNSPAQAQSADLVLCDRVAADPSDPDKPKDVQGVREIAQSDIATAIKFCRVASAASRRALYQLGRAYAANQQMPDAVSAYRKAADKGSTSAMVELGVMLATGSGVAKDEAQARKLFERAAAGGNPAASPISRRSRAAAAHHRIRPRPAHRRIPSRREPCLPKRRRRIRRKRSISSD